MRWNTAADHECVYISRVASIMSYKLSLPVMVARYMSHFNPSKPACKLFLDSSRGKFKGLNLQVNPNKDSKNTANCKYCFTFVKHTPLLFIKS